MPNKKFSSLATIFAAAIAVFSAANFARAASSSVTISEVLINGTSGKEFIELYNPTGNIIDMSGWILNYYSKDRDWLNPYRKKFFPADSILGPNEFFLISIKTGDYSEEGAWNLGYSSYQLNNTDGAIGVFPNENFSKQNAMDVLSWGAAKVNLFEGLLAPENKSLEKIDLLGDNEKENWQESSENGGTPGEEPKICGTETISADENSNTTNSNDGTATSSEKCAASSADIKINEVFPYPSSSDEFVEIKNTGADCINVSGWKVMDEAGHKKTFPENSIIEPGEYLYLKGNLYLNNDLDTAYLLDANGNAKNDALDKVFYEKAKENCSYALSGGSFFWTSAATPGERNIITNPEAVEKNTTETNNPQEATENYTSGANIYLNEILPNPEDGSDGEYIEIANDGTELVDLFGWRVKDASKSKGYQLKEHTILNPGEYLAIYRPDSKIALNNSDESVYLYNPKGEIASSVSFAKSQKNASYNFDGEVWKWSKYLTPGKKNKFDSEPSVKITKPKHAHKDLFTEFSAKAKDRESKKLKYAWDFGDGKKSYLAKTSHKYLATGKYTVTLSVSDDSQTIEKSFSLQVKKYPRPDLEITKMVPNPAGNDSDGEIIEIKNNSGQKIDLNGWKIATGSGEKISNHPISGEVSINPNETKTITREFSKFSLNNKAGKVRLVMPDGKVIDEVAYSKEKIADDEVYAKIDGEWKWIEPGAKDENTDEGDTTDKESNSVEITEKNMGDGEVLGATDENQSVSSSYSFSFNSESAYIFLSRINFFSSSKQKTNFCSASNPSSNIAYLLASLI